jgi:hypothetical protein
MSAHDGSPGVLYVIVFGASAASSVEEFIRLAQDNTDWLVRVIATPMGERFIDAVHLAALTGDGCGPGSGCRMNRMNSLPPTRSWWPRPRKACCTPSAFGRFSEARVIRVRS